MNDHLDTKTLYTTRTVNLSGANNTSLQVGEESAVVDIHFSIASLNNRYKIGAIIGSGGNATVVEAYDRDLKRKVAVKLLKAKYHTCERTVRRFLNEARITAKLQHPGVVPVYEVGYIGNKDFFFSMKKVEGQTFRDMLNEDPSKRNPRGLLKTFDTICETMAYAHANGITHRDLKPENLMIENYGSILIMDWGLAKDSNQDSIDGTLKYESTSRFENNSDLELTMTGEISGTPSYMSPEQALGMMNKLNASSDVFSLGILLYEIITGFNPFARSRGTNYREILEAIKHSQPALIERNFKNQKVKVEMAAICMKCLEKLPDDRYKDAGALFVDLKKCRENRTVSAFRTDYKEQFMKWIERKTKFITVTAVIITALMLAYMYRNSAKANIEKHLVKIDEKVNDLVKNQERLTGLRLRFATPYSHEHRKILREHEDKIMEKWLTAKGFITLLSITRENALKSDYATFMKKCWLLEIDIKIQRGLYNDAEQSMLEFHEFIKDKDDVWLLNKRQNIKLLEFQRKLGKELN
ncbi:MAG: serine/threonine protein kinase [Lentisphaeraceae bacterium]|nr:serine/threonine protein kinase [Lentisphaeraceae bacterium]